MPELDDVLIGTSGVVEKQSMAVARCKSCGATIEVLQLAATRGWPLHCGQRATPILNG